MAEVAEEETCQEIEQSREDSDEREDGASPDSEEPYSNFLQKLNLIIMVLSLYSFPSEDDVDDMDNGTKLIENYEAKDSVSRSSHNRRRELHKVNLSGRRAQIHQTMNKDCRHGRRM